MDIKNKSSISQSSIPEAEIDNWVFQEKVKLLYRNQTQSWVLSILASAIVAYLSLESHNVTTGLIWWAIFVCITLLRTWNTIKFCQAIASGKIDNYKTWFQRFFWLTFITGVAWGAGGIMIGAGLSPLSQVYIFIVLLGVSAAAIPLLGVVQNVMLAFQVPTMIPYLIYVAILLQQQGIMLIFMFGLYMIGMMFAIRRMDTNLSESLGLQYEKSELANSLTVSNQQLQNANEKLETLMLEDSLTGLYNRRYFEMQLEAEWKREARDHKILSLMVIDIDYFKLYNDTYGHAEGDECLKSVAQVLKGVLHRSVDVIARIGGEEFVVLLPGVDIEGAKKIAETMQTELRQEALTHATSPLGESVTVSIGMVSIIPSPDVTALGMFKAADKALYKAKAKGRDQYVVGEMEILES